MAGARQFRVWVSAAALAAAGLAVACIPGLGPRHDLPADGTLRIVNAQTRVSVVVPASVRADAWQTGPDQYAFTAKRSGEHTVMAGINAAVVNAGKLNRYRVEVSDKSPQEVLDAYLAELEPLERASPGRPENVLRSFDHVGGARGALAAAGVICDERALVAEDRSVPGQSGRLYLYYGRYYTCVDPRTQVPVELIWTERLPADSGDIGSDYEVDSAAFFESMRFEP